MIFVRKDTSGDLPALFDKERGLWTSYDGLAMQARARALAFERPSKKLAFVFVPNSLASIVDILGLMEAGHAVALLDTSIPYSLACSLLHAYQPDFVVGVECPGVAAGQDMPGAQRARGQSDDLRVIEVEQTLRAEIHPDLALLLSTSGSTGSPKFVRLSRTNITANATAIAQVLKIAPSDRVLAHLPLHYSFGFSVLTSYLSAGASIVTTSHSLASAPAWQLFREQACTSLPGVPSHFEILRRLDIDRLKIPSLECLMQAGGRMPFEMVTYFGQKMAARNGRLFIMYGQTEAAPRMTTLPAGDTLASPDSVGPALPGGRIETRDPSGRTLPAGKIGEVIYFGPNVMMGYATSRDDLGRPPELGDGLHTGDLGYVDERGYLTITGRANRFAKVHGVRVSLDEVEKMVGKIGMAAAIEADENKILVVVGQSDTERIHQSLVEALRLPSSSIEVRRVAQIPMKSNGKVDYSKLSALT